MAKLDPSVYKSKINEVNINGLKLFVEDCSTLNTMSKGLPINQTINAFIATNIIAIV